MKYLNDYNNMIEYAKKEAREEGLEKGMKRGMQQLKQLFALWESGVPLAEARRKFGLGSG